MSEIQASDLSNLSSHPGYRAILRTVLKTQIKQLVEQLSYFAGEEALLLSASITDGTLSHIGSRSAESFLRSHDQVKTQFLGFCLNKHKKSRPPESTSRNLDRQSRTEQSAERETDSPATQPTIQCSAHNSGPNNELPNSQKEDQSNALPENESPDSTEHINNKGSPNACDTEKPGPSRENQTDNNGASEVTKSANSTSVTQNNAKVKKVAQSTIKTFLAKKAATKNKTGDNKNNKRENRENRSVEKEAENSANDVKSKAAENKDGKEIVLNTVTPKTEPVDPFVETNNPQIDTNSPCIGAANSLDRVVKGLDMTCDNITEDSDHQPGTETNTAAKDLAKTLLIIKEEPPESPDESSDEKDSQSSRDSEAGDNSAAEDADMDSAIGIFRDGQLSWTTPDLVSRYTRKRKAPSVPGTPQKRNVIEIEVKYQAVLDVEAGQKRKEVARRLNITQSTLAGWMKNSAKIKEFYLTNDYGPQRKRLRQSNFPDIDTGLLNWSRDAKIHGIHISYALMCEKANEVARDLGYTEEQFTCSHSWVDRFKARYGFNTTKNDTFPMWDE